MRMSPLRFLTLAPTLGLSLLFLSPKVTGILSAVVLVGVLITLHELGHFCVARWMKVPVDVFSIGFGKRLVGFRWKETDMRLSLVPLGGYVQLAGEPDEAGPASASSPAFLEQPTWKRILFYTGGILANLATAWVLWVVLCIDDARNEYFSTTPLPIAVVRADMPAEKAGLRAGDQVVALDHLRFPDKTFQDATLYIQTRANQTVTFSLYRQGQALQVPVTPETIGGLGMVGIEFGEQPLRVEARQRSWSNIPTGIQFGTRLTLLRAKQILVTVGRLVTGRMKVTEVGGLTSIVVHGGKAAESGWRDFLNFAAIISLNLAVLNALPIPALDGSHVVFLVVERIRGKEIPMAVKERILTAGFIFLLAFIVLINAMDVWKLKR